MKPEQRAQKAPEKFTFPEDHVLQIDRKEKSLLKMKKVQDRQVEKLRKQQERLKMKENRKCSLPAPNSNSN